MARDLEGGTPQVHAAAARVLGFWFDQVPADKWFAKDDALDRLIAERFEPLRETVLASDGEGWDDDPHHLLAAVVLLDQFSRNVHRGSARAYEADALARRLTRHALERGWDAGLNDDERQFLYMPLMHSESADDQADSVRLFAPLGGDPDHYAKEHARVIDRFGRFPSRNAALGRPDRPEECAYLSSPGAGW